MPGAAEPFSSYTCAQWNAYYQPRGNCTEANIRASANWNATLQNNARFMRENCMRTCGMCDRVFLDPYYSCSDIRIFSHRNDLRVTLRLQRRDNIDDFANPRPATILSRLFGLYGDQGFTENNVNIVENEFVLDRATKQFSATFILSDILGFTTEDMLAKLQLGKANKQLDEALRLDVVTISSEAAIGAAAATKSSAGTWILVILIVGVIGALIFIKLKKPELWEKMCPCLSGGCLSGGKGVEL